MASLAPAPYTALYDDNGNPLSGGKIYTYSAGTTTPKATYTDSSGATPLSNPVVLDSAGRAVIFLVGSYKFVIKDSLDNTIRTVDNIVAGGVINDGDYGDITVSGGGATFTIDNAAVTLPKIATQAANTLVANASGSTASPTAVTYNGAVASGGVLKFFNSALIGESMLTTTDSYNNATPIPLDNTKPQITEGKEFTTVTVTPLSASSILEIEVIMFMSSSTGINMVAAVFQDSTADCIASGWVYGNTANQTQCAHFKFKVSAGSTSSRTYRLRFGGASGTTYVNTAGGTALYGATTYSGIRVTEILP